MEYVIAALMACLSFLVNRLFMRYVGPVTVISLGPVTEEAAKTLFAYYLGAAIIPVHALFGVIEAIYDWVQDESRHLTAPLLSIMGHSFFGAVTAGVLSKTGSVWLGLAAGSTIHVTYNVIVVRILANKADKNI